ALVRRWVVLGGPPRLRLVLRWKCVLCHVISAPHVDRIGLGGVASAPIGFWVRRRRIIGVGRLDGLGRHRGGGSMLIRGVHHRLRIIAPHCVRGIVFAILSSRCGHTHHVARICMFPSSDAGYG